MDFGRFIRNKVIFVVKISNVFSLASRVHMVMAGLVYEILGGLPEELYKRAS